MKRSHIPYACILVAILLSGCAGSASHKVVTVNQTGDEILDCDAIRSEITKAEILIEGVNQNKEDISGKDVVDTIIWFPLNLIAKDFNYNYALSAANARISQLKSMQEKNNCVQVATEQATRAPGQSGSLSPIVVTRVVYVNKFNDIDEPSKMLADLLKKGSQLYGPKNLDITYAGVYMDESFYFKPKQRDTAKKICSETKASLLLGGNWEHFTFEGMSDDFLLVAFNCVTEEIVQKNYKNYSDHSSEWQLEEDFRNGIKDFIQEKKPFSRF